MLPRRHVTLLGLVSTTTASLFLSACLGVKFYSPTPPLRIPSAVPATVVIADVTAEKGLVSNTGVRPLYFDRALRREIDSEVFQKLFFERDLTTAGVRATRAYLVRYRIEKFDSNTKTDPAFWVIIATSILLVPILFIGLARNTSTRELDVRMKIYDVTAARVERVKDERTSEFFNSYDVSAIAPLMTKNYNLVVKYAVGSGSEVEDVKRLFDELDADLARQLLNQSLPDIRRAVQ